MLYPKNQEKELRPELFRNPTAEYRATPFWAWNCELREDLLKKEIEDMKEMGFGGFHMHCRVGMATPYLSDEFMHLISMCVDEAKKKEMLAWLYDEDLWPSGFAGGMNTKDPESRQKLLFFTCVPYRDDTLTVPEDIAVSRDERPTKYSLLACYDIEFDEAGCLISYRQIPASEKASHQKWFAYLEYAERTPRFNGETYCDTLQKPVIENFIKLTHERYKKAVGNEFGKAIPAIFTDEPQFRTKRPLKSVEDKQGAVMPFTTDFGKTFREAYGFDLFESLPEVFFELPGGAVSRTRWCFHDHSAERFASAFADTIGDWCAKNGIAMTGHMMQEPSLYSQTCSLGDCMRSYRGFTIPGIDMLADRRELSTAKQCQSAVHQYGREAMLSELYGVTNWYFDFKGHKLQGDWQAALGVTVRVPHLFWVSMRGEAKRDYPAAIGYQSPWYREYSYIENHFARVNTAMTRGKPIVHIGVIHPIESYWLCFGPFAQTTTEREERSARFFELINWLLGGTLDFDFISESLLPTQNVETKDGFCVGEMSYRTVVVPGLSTIRATTLDALEAFVDAGGKVVFLGNVPQYVDAVPSDRAAKLAAKSEVIDWSMKKLFDILEPEREVSIRNDDDCLTTNLLYQLRTDGEKRHLFLSHIEAPKDGKFDTTPIEGYQLTLKGEWKLTLMDTLTGTCRPLAAAYHGGNTHIHWEAASCDSLLLEMERGQRTEGGALCYAPYPHFEDLAPQVSYTLEEPNVLLLDHPRYAIGGGEWQPAEEILRAGGKIRDLFGIPRRSVQPWLQPIDKTPKDTVSLSYEFESDLEISNAVLALESIEYADVTLNGVPADMTDLGWYVDEDSIRKIALPPIHRGKNTLVVNYRFCGATQLEAMYLLGHFGVECHGCVAKIVPPAEALCAGDVVSQTLPFYGGNITYHFLYEGAGKKALEVQKFAGSAISVAVDGVRVPGLLALPPHRISLGELKKGRHTIDVTLYGNRYNTFGAIHSLDMTPPYCGPGQWRVQDAYFTNDYLFHPSGILTTPRILDEE